MSKITAYAALAAPADADVLAGVDVSDTTMAATGTTKKLALSDLKTYVKTGPVSLASTPGAPASTTSQGVLVMMGLGSSWALTPGSSGKVLINITGTVSTDTVIATATYGCRFGTGTAPVNGAAVTGTRFGAPGDPAVKPQTAGVGVPFAFTALLSLTPGTAYWFDIALDTSLSTDAAHVNQLSFTAVEIS